MNYFLSRCTEIFVFSIYTIDTFCTFPRIAKIRIDLPTPYGLLCTLWMHYIKTHCTFEKIWRLVRSICLLALHFGFIHPTIQITHRAICTNGKLWVETSTLKCINKNISVCFVSGTTKEDV